MQNLILQSEKSLKRHIKMKNSHKSEIHVIYNGINFNLKNNEIGEVYILHEISKIKKENQLKITNRKRDNQFKISKYLLLRSLIILLIIYSLYFSLQ